MSTCIFYDHIFDSLAKSFSSFSCSTGVGSDNNHVRACSQYVPINIKGGTGTGKLGLHGAINH